VTFTSSISHPVVGREVKITQGEFAGSLGKVVRLITVHHQEALLPWLNGWDETKLEVRVGMKKHIVPEAWIEY